MDRSVLQERILPGNWNCTATTPPDDDQVRSSQNERAPFHMKRATSRETALSPVGVTGSHQRPSRLGGIRYRDAQINSSTRLRFFQLFTSSSRWYAEAYRPDDLRCIPPASPWIARSNLGGRSGVSSAARPSPHSYVQRSNGQASRNGGRRTKPWQTARAASFETALYQSG